MHLNTENPKKTRADEIRELIATDTVSRALNRYMDYARDFTEGKAYIHESIMLTGECRALIKAHRQVGNKRGEINDVVKRILESLEAMESEWVSPAVSQETQSELGGIPSSAEKNATAVDVTAPKNPTSTKLKQAKDLFKSGSSIAVKKDEDVPLKAIDLEKTYKTGLFTLSAKAEISLKAGEIMGLVGHNGCGKTTLLRILTGELKHDKGMLAYGFQKTMDWSAIKSQIAYVAQRPSKWFGTLGDNLHLAAAFKGVLGEENASEVNFILNRLNLEAYRDSHWSELSGGFLMRYELARALVWQPKLLILDEPLAPLDIEAQHLFLQDLRDLADSLKYPLAVIISSQHLFEVEAVADRIIFLNRGELSYYGALADLAKNRSLNSFEIRASSSNEALSQQIRCIEGLTVRDAGLNLIVQAPLEFKGKQLLDILEKRGIEVTYYRDISGSTRKMFHTEEYFV